MRLSKMWSYKSIPVDTVIGRKRIGGQTIYGKCLGTTTANSFIALSSI